MYRELAPSTRGAGREFLDAVGVGCSLRPGKPQPASTADERLVLRAHSQFCAVLTTKNTRPPGRRWHFAKTPLTLLTMIPCPRGTPAWLACAPLASPAPPEHVSQRAGNRREIEPSIINRTCDKDSQICPRCYRRSTIRTEKLSPSSLAAFSDFGRPDHVARRIAVAETDWGPRCRHPHNWRDVARFCSNSRAGMSDSGAWGSTPSTEVRPRANFQDANKRVR